MNYAIMIILLYCDDFELHQFLKCRESGSLQRTRDHLGWWPPKDEATCSAKGTVCNS